MSNRGFALFAAVLWLVAGYSAPAVSQDVPSLVGTWISTHHTQSSQGFTTIEVELVIDEQQDGLFNGQVSWRLLEIGDSGSEDVLGVIDWDNETVVIVNVNDTGYIQARLVNDVTMEHVYYESGANAVVSRGVWQKQLDTQN
ncbi:hypothetical protein [Bauldia sp.]|uniref:hypothetical protein n=1 Tax=Bauldia sp. TaxID=2575872 RepID=UPI003BABE781